MTLRRKLLLTFAGMAVVPIAVIGALAALEMHRLAVAGGEEALRQRLDTLSRLINREVEVERFHLQSLVAEWVDPSRGGRPRGPDLLGWLITRPALEIRMAEKPPVAIRYRLLDPTLPTCEVAEGHFELARVVIRRTRVPVQGLPAAYRLLQNNPAGPGGAPPPVLTVPGASGTVLAILVPVAADSAAPAAAGPRYLVEEMSLLTLLDHILSEPAFYDMMTSFAAIPAESPGRWTFIYHSDPTLIGLDASQVDWPPGVTAPMVSGAAAGGRRQPGGASQPGPSGGTRQSESGGRRQPGQPPSSSLAKKGPGRPAWTTARSGDYLYAAGIEPVTGWFMGGSLSLAPRLEPLRHSFRLTLILLVLMAALVTAGILLVTRGIGRAVEEIASNAEAIVRGDFQRAIRVDRSDEFGAIADDVNQMARDLMITAESGSIARLSARLAHDLKGVASQMNLLVYNLRENYDDPEFRAEFQGLMRALIGQVESLVLQLRKGGEDLAPEFEPVDLDAMVQRVVQSQVRATCPGIALEERFEAPGPVMAHAGPMEEVLKNVLANAVEAMEGTGHLRVQTGPISDSARRRPGGPTHFVEIEDSGPGMTQEFINDGLFRPFVTTKARGLGLGMYQVRRALIRMGGRIDVSSHPGSGTRIRIEVGQRGDDSRR